MTMLAGAAVVDITPPAGLGLCGFGARTEPATGAHDRLTARALVVGDTAIVVADVIGIDAGMSRRIRARCGLDSERVVVAATHTHGGPVSMAGRLGGGEDAAYLQKLEDGCVAALDAALAVARPAAFFIGAGGDPDVGRNRRQAGGPVDRAVTLLRVRGLDGQWIAALTAYACHPVVVGAWNRQWTADYPGFVRRRLEAAHPGAVGLFLTGCAGDVNTGHTASASNTLAETPERSFAEAERLGEKVATAALTAPSEPLIVETVTAANAECRLVLARRERESNAELAARWRGELAAAPPAQQSILMRWIEWAETTAARPLAAVPGRVTVLCWGELPIVALPGEIFSETGLAVRAAAGTPAFVIGYCEDNPGYIPPAAAYAAGGYEVEEAHRYYDLPASFAPGAAEALRDAASGLLR
jgi:hypothetical protein